jgi:hypothetical protein
LKAIFLPMKFTSTIRSAFLLGLPFFLEHSALAGWTGQMNGLGQGRTSVSVNSPVAGLKTAEWITPAGTVGQTTVSAAIPPAGYQRDGTLPNPLTTTITKSKGSPNYFWQKTLIPGGGDGTDNPRIQERVTILPVECPLLDMTTGVVWDDAQEKSGYITVVATATGGTATLLRGFERTDGGGEPDPDLDYYDKNKGKLLWEIMLVGPFEYTESCPFKIYFKIEGDKSKLWFSTDGVALSKEFKISCPQNNVIVPCGGTTYPVTAEGGCGTGPATISYSINPDQLIPGADFVEVTATAEDGNHNKVQCKFFAKRAGLSAILCNDVEFSCFTGPGSYSPTPVGACGNVTYTYTPTLEGLPIDVPTVVHVMGEDGEHNKAYCSFTATRHALQFNGFFPPLQAPGGTCGPNGYVETIKKGSLIPVKFTTSCDGQITFGGEPPVCKFYLCGGPVDPIITGGFKQVAGAWHFQIDTSLLPSTGVYRIVAVLQDHSEKQIVVRIK